MSDDNEKTFYLEDLQPNPLEEQPTTRDPALRSRDGEVGVKMLEPRRQATLIMLSGGIDSTYALAKLLRESDDDIIAHHVHLINIEGRHKIEAERCRKIVAFCKVNHRKFYFTESAIDRHRFRSFGRDVHTVAFEAGFVATSFLLDRGYQVDRWTFGSSLDDVVGLGQAKEFEDVDIMQQCIKLSCHPNPPPRMFQLPYITKKAQMDYLGEELTDLCWTCRWPVYGPDGIPGECGKCSTCEHMGKIRRGEETIPRRTKPD